jgi:hypothetical protein
MQGFSGIFFFIICNFFKLNHKIAIKEGDSALETANVMCPFGIHSSTDSEYEKLF